MKEIKHYGIPWSSEQSNFTQIHFINYKNDICLLCSVQRLVIKSKIETFRAKGAIRGLMGLKPPLIADFVRRVKAVARYM